MDSPLELCSAVWTVDHYHLIAIVREQQELSRFMQHLACNVSKEIGGRIRGWRGSFWERRYDGIPISEEPEAQWSRLKYSLSHGVKEQLVVSPLEWPGVHSAGALVHGEPLEGYWWNRSKEVAALGIRVNAVRPGFIDTEIHASGGEPERIERVKHLVPMGRGGEAEEVARAILWLLSEEASYSTGAFIDVAGGK